LTPGRLITPSSQQLVTDPDKPLVRYGRPLGCCQQGPKCIEHIVHALAGRQPPQCNIVNGTSQHIEHEKRLRAMARVPRLIELNQTTNEHNFWQDHF